MIAHINILLGVAVAALLLVYLLTLVWRASRMPRIIAVPAMIMGAVVSGCMPQSPPGFNEQNLPISSQALKQYPALFSVDRLKKGFPALPTNGDVRILTVDRTHWKLEYPPPNYDVSFQIYEGQSFYPYSSRFVALKLTNAAYEWVSEQMMFTGPKRYMADGQLCNEAISIACEKEQIAYQGTNIHGTAITYSGPDRRLSPSGDHVDGLTLSQIGPILREWGYKYDVDVVQQIAAPVVAPPDQ